MICDCKDCPHDAEWHPVLVLYARAGTVPARAVVGLKLCDECKARVLKGDIITDQGWQQIREGFRAAGRAVPCRRLTRLEWISVHSHEAEQATTIVLEIQR